MDNIIMEIANVGLTLLFIAVLVIVTVWVGENL